METPLLSDVDLRAQKAAVDRGRGSRPEQAAATETGQSSRTAGASAFLPISPSPELVDQAVGALNEGLDSLKSSLRFQQDESTGRTMIQVVDEESGDVIRQIPPEYVLKLVETMEELSGVLLNEQA